jgi:proteasome lid subunit RPN8/RPN11
VTAVYHSHVDMGAYLSELDLEYAEHGLFPFPEADQIVVSVVDGRVAEDGVAVFRRDGQGGSFRGRRLAPGAL